MKVVTAIDTETTGFLRSDRVICFGAVLMSLDEENGILKLEASQELYNNVNVKINTEARRVHGIDNERLRILSEGKSIRDVEPFVKAYIELSDYIVGHNIIAFDARMIQETYPSVGPIPGSKLIDTMTPCSKHFGKRTKLSDAVKLLKIPCEEDFKNQIASAKLGANYHTALYDAYCTARVYAKLKGYRWEYDPI